MSRIAKYLLFIPFVFMSILHANSQTFVLRGGAHLNDVFYENASGNLSDVFDLTTVGFHIGATMENPFSEMLSLESGLLVSLKGFKIDELQDGITVRNKTDLYYIGIPVAIKAKFDLSEKTKWYVSAGPVFDIGMAGSYKTVYDWSGSKQAEKEKVKWGNGEGEIKRLDFGISFGGGIEFNKWLVGLYYDLGLTDISSDANDENTLKSRLWKISVGYTLGEN